jgi:hypothetical protein
MIFRTFDDRGRFIPVATAHALYAHAQALFGRAGALEEASGRAAYRRIMARNRYTVDPVYRLKARDIRADNLRAKARAILARIS